VTGARQDGLFGVADLAGHLRRGDPGVAQQPLDGVAPDGVNQISECCPFRGQPPLQGLGIQVHLLGHELQRDLSAREQPADQRPD
jgi:hypothetical protein